VALSTVLFHYVGDFLAIDSCLDSGRAFNYSLGECGSAEHYETKSYVERFWWLILVGSASAITGVYLLTKSSKATPKSGAL
jgi:hypothetical protein